jgi:hypothetical protein
MRRARAILYSTLLLAALPACRSTAPSAGSSSASAPGASAEREEPNAAPPTGEPEVPCDLPPELVARGWPRSLAPTSPTEPQSSGAVAFTLAVMPDTQYYASCRAPHFKAQSEWLAREQERRRILAVLHLGDITEHNEPEEWRFAQGALAPLVEKLPLVLTTGNHDYGTAGAAERRATRFQEFFPAATPATRPYLAASLREGDLENAYYRFPLPLPPGRPAVILGVLVLEWSPRESAVAWAKGVLAAHPKDRLVLLTHAYLYHDGTRYDWVAKGDSQEWNPHAYGTAKRDPKGPPSEANRTAEGVYDGEALWQALVRGHPGALLTLNGHVLDDGVAHLTSRGDAGNAVHQLLANYQALEQGGLGYLRLLEFSADGRTLRAKTYSPSLGAWATAPEQDFELALDPPLFR